MTITGDESDRQRFVRLLYYMNDVFQDPNWESDVFKVGYFQRPAHWPDRIPLVEILAWTLMPNHFHLILREIQPNGVSKFMQRLCGSMTTHFNAKYQEKGSIFQGAYKSRTADTRGDEYLRYLAVYVMVKNPFELYEGGLENAIKDFDNAYAWAIQYPFCSLSEYAGTSRYPHIIEKSFFETMFGSSDEFQSFSRECMKNKLDFISSTSN